MFFWTRNYFSRWPFDTMEPYSISTLGMGAFIKQEKSNYENGGGKGEHNCFFIRGEFSSRSAMGKVHLKVEDLEFVSCKTTHVLKLFGKLLISPYIQYSILRHFFWLYQRVRFSEGEGGFHFLTILSSGKFLYNTIEILG